MIIILCNFDVNIFVYTIVSGTIGTDCSVSVESCDVNTEECVADICACRKGYTVDSLDPTLCKGWEFISIKTISLIVFLNKYHFIECTCFILLNS